MTSQATNLRSQLQSTLGDAYTIERELGGGGMSRVFVATERALGRKVVIKVLPNEMAGAVNIERFKREIATVAQLQHPHIVPIHAAGDTDRLPWFAMPFVSGESLRARISREGELPLSDTVRMLREVASALACAHEAGVVHRDIKPDNVLLSGGVAMVTDFGVAKALDSAAIAGDTLTTRGVALGTPAYMAPEQASADPHIDHRADLYSWGVLAYEMLTGHTPFAGRPASAMLAAHITEVADPVNTRRSAVPASLATLVMQCLAKRPADRVQTAAEIVRMLDDVATPSSGSPATTLAASRRPWRRTGLAVGTAGAIVLGVIVLLSQESPAFVPGRSMAVVSSSDEMELDAAISPDGKFVAYAVGPPLNHRIEVRQISGGRTVHLTDDVAGDHRWPQWAPDGATVLFTTPRALYSIPALGGQSTRLMEDETGSIRTGGWSPRGDAVVFVARDTLWTKPVDHGTPMALAFGGDIVAPAWSPDGGHIAYVRGNGAFVNASGNIAPSSIWIVSTKGGSTWPVTDSSRLNFGPAWAPDGRAVLFISDRDGTRDVYQQSLDGGGRPNGTVHRITNGLNAATISLDASGTHLAYTVLLLRRNVWAAPIQGDRVATLTDARQVTRGNQTVEGVDVSRDGRWLLYDTNRNGNEDIFKLDLTDSSTAPEPIWLTRDKADDFLARLSPDGRRIVFYSTRMGTRDIFVMNADGQNVERITDLPGSELYPDWSPDGQRIVFDMRTDGGSTIGVVTRTQDSRWSQPRVLTADGCLDAAGRFPRWSPDGRWISMRCEDGGIALVSLEGRATRAIRVPGVRAAFAEWGADPAVVYVKNMADGSIWAVPITGAPPRLVFRIGDARRVAPRQEFATDGKRLFFTLSSDEADIWLMEISRR